MKFAAPNRDNVKDVDFVHKYQGLTVIAFNNPPNFRRLIYLTLKALDKQNSK